MREIKFRAWHKIAEKMTEVHSFTNIDYKDEDEYKYVVTSEEAVDDGVCWKYRDIVLMQYTGLKDKNEKEIYEGDVIKIEVKKRNKGDFPNLKNYLVVFEDFSFSYKDNDGHYATPLNIFIKGVEVISNIYENPELLDNK